MLWSLLTRTSVIYVHVFRAVMPADRLMLNPLLTLATINFKSSWDTSNFS